MRLSFNINANRWTSATPITGNVRAVGLATPAYDEWSTMWGENQHALFRDSKTDQRFFSKVINGGLGGGFRFMFFFSYDSARGPSVV